MSEKRKTYNIFIQNESLLCHGYDVEHVPCCQGNAASYVGDLAFQRLRLLRGMAIEILNRPDLYLRVDIPVFLDLIIILGHI